MESNWLNTQSDDEAASRAEDFWAAMKQGLDAGAFWADRIRQYRDEPGKRLQMAMDHLPLPAAFREAAVAARVMIRSKRKARICCQDELSLLYWLAAIDSFILPYADRLKEPGYNVVASIPGKTLRSLPIEYRKLGYNELGLLNKTDKKWLVESYGEPESHATLNRMYRSLWDDYEDKLILQRRAETESFRLFLAGLKRKAVPPPSKHGLGWLGKVVILVVCIYLAIQIARFVIQSR